MGRKKVNRLERTINNMARQTHGQVRKDTTKMHRGNEEKKTSAGVELREKQKGTACARQVQKEMEWHRWHKPKMICHYRYG